MAMKNPDTTPDGKEFVRGMQKLLTHPDRWQRRPEEGGRRTDLGTGEECL